MQDAPRYDDVVGEVVAVPRRAAARRGRDAGVEEIWVDPGIGFGKTVRAQLDPPRCPRDVLVATGVPVADRHQPEGVPRRRAGRGRRRRRASRTGGPPRGIDHDRLLGCHDGRRHDPSARRPRHGGCARRGARAGRRRPPDGPARQVGPGHRAPQLHLDPAGQARRVRAPGRLRRATTARSGARRRSSGCASRASRWSCPSPCPRTTCTTTTRWACPGGTAPSPAPATRRPTSAGCSPSCASCRSRAASSSLHQDELGDRLSGLMAAYVLWNNLVPGGPQAISVIEQLLHRQLGPDARSLVALVPGCPNPAPPRCPSTSPTRCPPVAPDERGLRRASGDQRGHRDPGPAGARQRRRARGRAPPRPAALHRPRAHRRPRRGRTLRRRRPTRSTTAPWPSPSPTS